MVDVVLRLTPVVAQVVVLMLPVLVVIEVQQFRQVVSEVVMR